MKERKTKQNKKEISKWLLLFFSLHYFLGVDF